MMPLSCHRALVFYCPSNYTSTRKMTTVFRRAWVYKRAKRILPNFVRKIAFCRNRMRGCVRSTHSNFISLSFASRHWAGQLNLIPFQEQEIVAYSWNEISWEKSNFVKRKPARNSIFKWSGDGSIAFSKPPWKFSRQKNSLVNSFL